MKTVGKVILNGTEYITYIHLYMYYIHSIINLHDFMPETSNNKCSYRK